MLRNVQILKIGLLCMMALIISCDPKISEEVEIAYSSLPDRVDFNFSTEVKQAINLLQSATPEQLDLFDHNPLISKETNQATATFIIDLKQHGLLEDNLAIWGDEFGRTNYSQGQLTETNFGHVHHPKCFTIFMAGAGVKKVFSLGATNDFRYNATQRAVHVADFQATLIHLLGAVHERLTFKS